MCYASGSIEQVTRTCIMCKVQPPRQVGCPHQPLSLCRNRQNHPRFDIVHFRTAELALFNGCGYCKWATVHANSTNDKSASNAGWPGCCRPPRPNEFAYIKGLADWVAVNKIWGTPIPPDAYQVATPSGSMRGLPSVRKEQARPSLANVSGLEKDITNLSIGSSPGTLRRKRSKSLTCNDDGSSRVGKHLEGKFPNSTIQSSLSQSNKRPTDAKPPLNIHLLPPANRGNSTSASSSGSGGSSAADSVTTVTSEGFTDYLSDESDQELQRQAESRAAELVIAKQEKDEFDAALRTVRHLSLQPPPEWNPQPPLSGPPRYHRDTFSGPIQVAIGQSRH